MVLHALCSNSLPRLCILGETVVMHTLCYNSLPLVGSKFLEHAIRPRASSMAPGHILCCVLLSLCSCRFARASMLPYGTPGPLMLATGVCNKNAPCRFNMSLDVYTPFPFNNVALVAWGGFGASKKTSPFGLDDAVLKSTLYLGKGVPYVAWLFSFLTADVVFRKRRSGLPCF